MSDIVAAIVPVAGPLMKKASKGLARPIPPSVRRFFTDWIPDWVPTPSFYSRLLSFGTLIHLNIFECKPERPMPVFHFHSEYDPIVPFGGDPKFGFPSIDSSIQKWCTLNGVDEV
jgi:poly(3-hydroxybutyrate) depolymerase